MILWWDNMEDIDGVTNGRPYVSQWYVWVGVDSLFKKGINNQLSVTQQHYTLFIYLIGI